MSADNDDFRDYTMMRVPRREYDKIVEARERYRESENHSYIGHLALGAFVGFLAGLAINEMANNQTPRRGRATRPARQRRNR